MRLDYGTLLSYAPIKLSIGNLRKPKLREIAELSFDTFNMYEAFLKMTPEEFYSKICGQDGNAFWNSLSDVQKNQMTMFDIIEENQQAQQIYISIFDFFFEEKVIFQEGFFVLLKDNANINKTISKEPISGVINRESFKQVLELIQQICCIYDNEEAIEEQKFKNKTARKLYEKMLKASKQNRRKADKDLSIPNIISAVSNCHPTINPINVWDLTIFTLLDSFNRMQINKVFDIDARRVSVWGDEKKAFNMSLWYKNNYDKK